MYYVILCATTIKGLTYVPQITATQLVLGLIHRYMLACTSTLLNPLDPLVATLWESHSALLLVFWGSVPQVMRNHWYLKSWAQKGR